MATQRKQKKTVWIFTFPTGWTRTTDRKRLEKHVRFAFEGTKREVEEEIERLRRTEELRRSGLRRPKREKVALYRATLVDEILV